MNRFKHRNTTQYYEVDGALPFNLFIQKNWRKGADRYLSIIVIPLVYNKHSGEMCIEIKTPFWRRTKGISIPIEINKLIQRDLGIPTTIARGDGRLFADLHGISIIVESNEYDYIKKIYQKSRDWK